MPEILVDDIFTVDCSRAYNQSSYKFSSWLIIKVYRNSFIWIFSVTITITITITNTITITTTSTITNTIIITIARCLPIASTATIATLL